MKPHQRFKSFRTTAPRHPSWDYAGGGSYFVTICVRDRNPVFGRIRNGIMGLSSRGIVATQRWAALPSHHPEAATDAFIVMPNHVHGILTIAPGPNLGNIVGAYKSSVTRLCRVEGYSGFAWQTGFHDRIIRNELFLGVVRRYIENNPAKWKPWDPSIDFDGSAFGNVGWLSGMRGGAGPASA